MNRKKQSVQLWKDFGHPAWIELSRLNLEYNWRSIQKVVGPTINIIPMLKSNAYGHGAVEIATLLQEFGAKIIGVSSVREAGELRENGVTTDIIIMDYVLPNDIPVALALHTTLVISDSKMFPFIEEAAKEIGVKCKVQIHIDTGMHREGVWPLTDVIKLIAQIYKSPYVELDGLFTHFATAGDQDPNFVQTQLTAFNKCLDAIDVLGRPLPKYIHAAGGAGVMRFPEAYTGRFTSIRPGNIIYGLPPGQGFPFRFTLKRVFSAFKAKLGGIKTIPTGDGVSYGLTWRAKKPSRIGIVFTGYTDGLRRSLSNKGHMLIKGQRVPIIGMIAMNQTVILLPEKGKSTLGDEVVIIGKQGKEEITLEEVAKDMGTIMFEFLVNLHAKRLPRIVIK